MVTAADRRAARRALGAALAFGLALSACTAPTPEAAAGGESWNVTAWGERFEIFPEIDPLVAGETAVSHTHVTRLADFSPLVAGEVEIVLADAGGETSFRASAPVRPGIYAVELRPERSGEFDLLFRIHDAEGSEEIRGGRVRVGDAGRPGGVLVAPAPRGGTDGGEPLDFLKEEQWRADFATEWVRPGRIAGGVSGLAKLRPPAGGETTLTAPVDAVVQPASAASWPFVGRPVGRGETLLRLVPLVAPDRSLATLEAELAGLEAEHRSARDRLGRLEELLAREAVSRREVEESRVQVATLDARRVAAERDLEAARAGRESGAAGAVLALRSPLAGEVARVDATPGTTVRAGDPLLRVVRTDVVWIEVAVAPAAARRLAVEGVRGVVLSEPESSPIRLEANVRLVSIAPELDPDTGTVALLLEAPRAAVPALGATLDAQVLSAVEREGIVVPASALVDDGGVAVVYLQLGGERFVRQEVHILERQGDRALVDRLLPGQRLVSRGGDAIRRSSLMASGEAHGHVH